jgi:hypothetical protein
MLNLYSYIMEIKYLILRNSKKNYSILLFSLSIKLITTDCLYVFLYVLVYLFGLRFFILGI